jgi:GNAT superfamily N-acetyltransferase
MSNDIRKMLNKIHSLRPSVNEGFYNITYSKSVDEDRTKLTAYINNNEVGSLSMEILFDAYQYEFNDVFDDEEAFDETYPDSEIVKIEHIEVVDTHKNTGIGSELMNRGMELMKDSGYRQFYLNASPMGFRGLATMELVNFYKKFGFKEILNQGRNVIMGVVFT